MRRLIVLAVAAAATSLACETSPPPGGTDLPDAARTEFACAPSCRPGFSCIDGDCWPACEPVCPAGTTCDRGLCAIDLPGGPGDEVLRNPCGGFQDIDGIPGTTCGPCGTGRWLCETEDRVVCVDPVGLNACGACGDLPGEPGRVCGDEMRWACTPEGGVECVSWFDANPCLGTVRLAEPPGRACGACNAGWSECDGRNATRCVEPPDPAPCACDPGTAPPLPCGTDAGACTRGMRFCGADGRYGSCVETPIVGPCDDGGTCPDGFCANERIHPYESLEDACVDELDDACLRDVCRVVDSERRCSADADCRDGHACVLGACQPLVTRPMQEFCNGIDDNCDGRIDDDARRTAICGSCPYNMMLITNEAREYGRRRICIDRYEASRPDATDVDAGSYERYSTSEPGHMPWSNLTAAQAAEACAGTAFNLQVPGGVAEKRLCVDDEWTLSCNVLEENYPYGDAYTEGACNDASSGRRAPAPTAEFPECSHIVPGGRFPSFDFSGNVAEWVRVGTSAGLAGGSYRSGERAVGCGSYADAPEEIDRSVGFRCCAAIMRVTTFDE